MFALYFKKQQANVRILKSLVNIYKFKHYKISVDFTVLLYRISATAPKSRHGRTWLFSGDLFRDQSHNYMITSSLFFQIWYSRKQRRKDHNLLLLYPIDLHLKSQIRGNCCQRTSSSLKAIW